MGHCAQDLFSYMGASSPLVVLLQFNKFKYILYISGCPLFTMCVCLAHSVVSDSVTHWTIACQAPLSMGFSRQEYWSGLPFPSPGDLPDPGFKPASSLSVLHCRQFLYPLFIMQDLKDRAGKAMRSVKKNVPVPAMFVCNKNIKHKKDSNIK